MRIVVTSDAHRDLHILKKIAMIEVADIYVHAGDCELEPSQILPFINVKGNCDYFDYPMYRILYAHNEQIMVMHGHTAFFGSMSEFAKAKGCNVLIYGHTHKYLEKFYDGILLLNPGSVSRPRDGTIPTYMILDIDDTGIKVTKKEVRF